MSKHKIQRRDKAHKYAGTTGHRLHAINMKNPNSQIFQLTSWIIRKFEYKCLDVQPTAFIISSSCFSHTKCFIQATKNTQNMTFFPWLNFVDDDKGSSQKKIVE